MGLALRLPLAGARRVKARRKPGRGGESHQHASSEPGGGLLVNPTCSVERGDTRTRLRARGREHSAMEGVSVRRKPLSLTRRRERRARRPGAMGMRSHDRICRGSFAETSEVTSQARRAVENTAPREVQREGAADQGSTRIALNHARERWGLWLERAFGRPSGVHVAVAAEPKLEVRRQAKLYSVGSSGKRNGRRPGLAAARLRPRVSLCAVRCSSAARRRVLRRARLRIGQSVGCS
jgi:hypothetical protein